MGVAVSLSGLEDGSNKIIEIWLCSIPASEERRLWVFENRVLRRVFGPKRDEVTGEWTPYPILCGW